MKIRTIIHCGCIAVFLTGTTACAQITHLGPNLPIIGNGPLAGQFVKAGNDAADRGSMLEARTNYQNALNVSPFDENATLGLARCAATVGDLKAAIRYYHTVISGHHEE